nr:M23 family metallopeptidase [Campylobacter sp.]
MKKYFYLIVILAICGGAFYISNLDKFEQNPPNADINSTIYTNLKDPIKIKISDDMALKKVRINLISGDKKQTLLSKFFEDNQSEAELELVFPKNIFLPQKEYLLKVEITDASYSNFFTGNKKIIDTKLITDTQNPEINVINQSYKIVKGGSGAVVFSVRDNVGLEEVYIQTNFGKKFIATPFYKDGYYASLVAWPAKEKNFSATVVAVDKAGNTSKSRIKYFLFDRKYKVSKIALTKSFLSGKIADLAEMYAKDFEKMSSLNKFKFVNETLRISNDEKIGEITSKVHEESIKSFYLNPFYPLKNSAAVGSFGDHRSYTFLGDKVSQSYHMGLDLASVAGADIVASNPAVVAFRDDNGIYGLNVLLYHGFGLYSLYGHCTSSNVNVGDTLKPESVVATTGTSGLALGDHLHFGILIQGIEVRPEEWMDKLWMKTNIFDVLNLSKQAIDKR